MNKNFDKCLSMLLVHEGGYVNHPKDPAGMTNLGVTKKTYDNYYNTNIDEQGMKQLTKADVEPIYRELYWLKTHCQELPSGVDWAVFDYAVNAGPSRAAKALQRAVGRFRGPKMSLILLDRIERIDEGEVEILRSTEDVRGIASPTG